MSIDEMPHLLSSRRPSDRKRILEILSADDGRDVVKKALQDYLQQWVNADWLDDDDIYELGVALRAMARQDMNIQEITEEVLVSLSSNVQDDEEKIKGMGDIVRAELYRSRDANREPAFN